MSCKNEHKNFFMKIEIGIMTAMTISNNKLVQDVQKLIKPSIVVIWKL